MQCICFLNDRVAHQVLGDIDSMFASDKRVETYRLFYGELIQREWLTPSTVVFIDATKAKFDYQRHRFMTDPVLVNKMVPRWSRWVPFVVGILSDEQDAQYYADLAALVEAYAQWFDQGMPLESPPWNKITNGKKAEHGLKRWQRQVQRYVSHCQSYA